VLADQSGERDRRPKRVSYRPRERLQQCGHDLGRVLLILLLLLNEMQDREEQQGDRPGEVDHVTHFGVLKDGSCRYNVGMSLVVDALTVGGALLLTVGTGNQAWAAQAEFRSLFGALRAAEDTVTGPEMVKVFGPVVYLLADVEPNASESGIKLRLSKILTRARPALRAGGLESWCATGAPHVFPRCYGGGRR
jgi:hypothetical protein